MPSCNPSLSNIRDVVSCEILKFLAIPLLLAPDCSLISCRTVSSTASVHAHRRLFRLILIAANDPLSHSCRWMRENIWWCGTGRLGKRAASDCLARRHLLLLSNDDWLHASNSYTYLRELCTLSALYITMRLFALILSYVKSPFFSPIPYLTTKYWWWILNHSVFQFLWFLISQKFISGSQYCNHLEGHIIQIKNPVNLKLVKQFA